MGKTTVHIAALLWPLGFALGPDGAGASQPQGSPVNEGVVVNGHLLSYQWEPTRLLWYWKDRAAPTEGGTAPAPDLKDIQWYLANVKEGRLTPLRAVSREEADALARLGDTDFMRLTHDHAPYRWRVAFGFLWATRAVNLGGAYHSTPLLRMQLDVGNGGGRDATPPGPASSEPNRGFQKEPVAVGETPSAIGNVSREESVFVRGAQPSDLQVVSTMPSLLDDAVRAARERGMRPRDHTVHFDFVPLSDRRIVLFTQAADEIILRDYHFRDEKNDRGNRFWKGQWRTVATFSSPFREPFHVAAGDGGYFFETDSGAVHGAEEAGGEWRTRPVWNDAKRPIIAMLARAEDPGAWVFGKDFYFNLAREPKPKPCRDVTQGRKELGEPMRTVYECARVLHEKGELGKAEAKK